MWRKENSIFVTMWICMDLILQIGQVNHADTKHWTYNKSPRNQDAVSTVSIVSVVDPDFLHPGSRIQGPKMHRISHPGLATLL